MDRFLTRPFVHLSLATALVAGFGLGAAAFGATLLGVPAGRWWPALAQAHGHAQVFGFAGLMVFGVAFVFLPRLRGAPLRGARFVPWVLLLYGGGVWLRVLAQTVGALVFDGGAPGTVVGPAMSLSAVLELAGAALAIGLLVRTGMHGPPLGQRAGVTQVLPLLVVAWSGLLAALLANLLSVVLQPPSDAALGRHLVAEPSLDALAVQLALLAWLVPLSVAFAARNFPLFLWTAVPAARSLWLGLALHVPGLVLGIGAWALGPQQLYAGGWALQGAALLWWTYAVGALGPKTRQPGKTADPLEAALFRLSRTPLTGAFAWLAVAGLLMLAGAASSLAGLPTPPPDAERHAVGAGFVLLLITGMALRLIPGFGGGKRRVNLRAAAIAVWAAQLSALLRVGPLLAAWLLGLLGAGPLPGVTPLLTLAGLAGMVSIAALWIALWGALAPPAQPSASAG